MTDPRKESTAGVTQGEQSTQDKQKQKKQEREEKRSHERQKVKSFVDQYYYRVIQNNEVLTGEELKTAGRVAMSNYDTLRYRQEDAEDHAKYSAYVSSSGGLPQIIEVVQNGNTVRIDRFAGYPSRKEDEVLYAKFHELASKITEMFKLKNLHRHRVREAELQEKARQRKEDNDAYTKDIEKVENLVRTNEHGFSLQDFFTQLIQSTELYKVTLDLSDDLTIIRAVQERFFSGQLTKEELQKIIPHLKESRLRNIFQFCLSKLWNRVEIGQDRMKKNLLDDIGRELLRPQGKKTSEVLSVVALHLKRPLPESATKEDTLYFQKIAKFAPSFLSELEKIQEEMRQPGAASFPELQAEQLRKRLAESLSGLDDPRDIGKKNSIIEEIILLWQKEKNEAQKDSILNNLLAELDPEIGIEANIQKMKEASGKMGNKGEIHDAVVIFERLQKALETAKSLGFYDKVITRPVTELLNFLQDNRRVIHGIDPANIRNSALRQKVVDIVGRHIAKERATVKERLAEQATQLKETLQQKLRTALPAFVHQRIRQNAAFSSSFQEKNLEEIQQRMTARVLKALDDEAAKLSLQGLSQAKMKRQLELLNEDQRLNYSLQTSSTSDRILEFRFSDGEKEGAVGPMSEQLSTPIFEFLRTMERVLDAEVDPLETAVKFATESPSSKANPPDIFSRLHKVNLQRTYKDTDTTHEKKVRTQVRNMYIKAIVTRQLLQDDAQRPNALLDVRKKVQKTLHLPIGAYVLIPKELPSNFFPENVFENGLKDAKQYLKEVLGYSEEQINTHLQNIELSAEKETLTNVFSTVFLNREGSAEIIDPRVMIADSLSLTKGRLDLEIRDTILGLDFDWRRYSDYGGTPLISSEEKQKRLTNLFNTGLVRYYLNESMLGQLDTALRQRVYALGEFKYQETDNISFCINIGAYLADEDKKHLLDYVAKWDDYNNKPFASLDMVKAEVISRLSNSEKIVELVTKVNAYLETLLSEITKNPQEFIGRMFQDETIDSTKLNAADWFCIITSVILGKFDARPTEKLDPPLVRGEKRNTLKREQLTKAISYGASLREEKSAS